MAVARLFLNFLLIPMLTLYITLLWAVFTTLLYAQPDLVWVRTIRVPAGAIPYIANNGNDFVFGEFFNTVDFDPGSGQTNLTAFGSSQTRQVILRELASSQAHTIDLLFCVPGVYYLHIQEDDRVYHEKIVRR